MQGSQAPLHARPKRRFEQFGLVAHSAVDLGRLRIRLGRGRCAGGRELAPDAFDLRAEEADRLAGGAHVLALVAAESISPALNFLELAPIHGRHHFMRRSI